MTFEPETNEELQLAECYVAQTGCNIFLTGKAGTGKTTFLKNLHRKTDKRLIVTAPTGVAAVNAGGVTLHSFFQIPLGPFVPGNGLYGSGNRSQYSLSREKKAIVENLDLLVIDEISMVRADLLDAVDSVLGRYRRNGLPFGGVQLLMIGDLHQLPPVAKKEDWELLRRYYDSIYFFSSRSLARAGFICIELKHIYRQTDIAFIKILNQLRNNRLDQQAIAELNRRYIKDFVPGTDEGYITLTTHNKNAETINNNRLAGLAGDVHAFTAEIAGEFPRHNYPAPEQLQLKKGAQVMFLRNDPTAAKRYFNGKIGEVKVLTDNRIEVVSPGDTENIPVEPMVWENVRYTLSPEDAKIKTAVSGTFKQFPLKLAWATTIHKSQGLTFENALIDDEAAFVHGQSYVALSRCKTLDGVVLSSMISSKGIDKDEALIEFDRRNRQNPPSEAHLRKAKSGFQQGLLLDCFDLKTLTDDFYRLARLLKEHAGTVTLTGTGDLEQTAGQVYRELYIVSRKFRHQLRHLFENGHLPESDPTVRDRLNKASVWFQEKFKEIFGKSLVGLRFKPDNTLLEAKIKEILDRLGQEKTVRLEGIKALENGFSPSDFRRRVSLAGIDHAAEKKRRKMRSPNPSLPDIDHPELVSELQQWRSQKAQDEGEAPHRILHQNVLLRIAKSLPTSRNDLKKIKGFGKKTVQKHGAEIIVMVSRYCQQQGIPAGEAHDEDTLLRKTDDSSETISETKMISYEMLQTGLTIEEIAAKRGLVKSTIERHLCHFIERGMLGIKRILSEERQAAIEKALNIADPDSLRAIKEQLGGDYSYGEIKIVLALRHAQIK